MQRTAVCVHITSQGDEEAFVPAHWSMITGARLYRKGRTMGVQLGPQEKPMACREAAQITVKHRASGCIGLAAGGVAPQSGGG